MTIVKYIISMITKAISGILYKRPNQKLQHQVELVSLSYDEIMRQGKVYVGHIENWFRHGAIIRSHYSSIVSFILIRSIVFSIISHTEKFCSKAC